MDRYLFGKSVGVRGDSVLVSSVGSHSAYIFRKRPDPTHPAQYQWNTTAVEIIVYQDQFGFGRACDMGATTAVVATTGNLQDKLLFFVRPESPFPVWVPEGWPDDGGGSGGGGGGGGGGGTVVGAAVGAVAACIALYVMYLWSSSSIFREGVQGHWKAFGMTTLTRRPHRGHSLEDKVLLGSSVQKF